jgi:hypothetical protein
MQYHFLFSWWPRPLPRPLPLPPLLPPLRPPPGLTAEGWAGEAFGLENHPADLEFPGHSRRLGRKLFGGWRARRFWDWAIPFRWTN